MSTPAPSLSLGDFGPLVLSTDVDIELIAKLKLWLPTYLRWLSPRVLSGKPLPTPRSYTNTIETAEFIDNQLPAMIVTTTSASAAIGGPNTFYDVAWRTAISCVLRGRRPSEARRIASAFGGAMVLCVTQKGRDPVVCNAIRYQTFDIAAVPDATGQGRYLCQATAVFTVHTDVAVQGSGGPAEPDADTYLGDALVTEVDVDVAGSELSLGGSGGPSP
jgi:hypothetical protein